MNWNLTLCEYLKTLSIMDFMRLSYSGTETAGIQDVATATPLASLITRKLSDTTDCIIVHCATVVTLYTEVQQD